MRTRYEIDLKSVIWGVINRTTLLVRIPAPGKEIKIYRLNGLSLDVWRMLTRKYDPGRILKDLARKYPVSKGRLRKDVRAFIRELETGGIINEIRQKRQNP